MNRQPYIAPEKREEHEATCFPQPTAEKPATAPKTVTKTEGEGQSQASGEEVSGARHGK